MAISKLSDRVRLLGTSLKNLNPTALYNKINELVDEANTYSVYSIILKQTGAAIPQATVLKNNLGDDVVWARNGDGDYTGTLLNAFPANKTFILGTIGNGDAAFLYAIRDTDSRVKINTYSIAGDAVDFNGSIHLEIRVYN